MFLYYAHIGLCLLSMAISFYVKSKLEKFLERNTAIATEKSLEEYKSVARLNMYGALAQIVLFVSAFGSFLANLFNQGFRGIFSLFLLGFAAGLMQPISELEEKARALTCTTTELEKQYKTISHTWKKKALPDF
jgi:hypothetical protein